MKFVCHILCVLLCAGGLHADYDVPRLADIQIDGDPSDWRDGGLHIGTLADEGHRLALSGDLRASLRLAWEPRGLLVLVEIVDDLASEAGDTLSLWSGDSVELYLSPQRGSIDIYQVAIAPGMDSATPILRHHIHDRRISSTARGANTPLQAERRHGDNGYTLEALIPLENLAIEAREGARFAFQIAVNDVDEAGGNRYQVMWFPRPGAYADSEQMHVLRLGKKGGDAVRGLAVGEYERFRRTAIQVFTPAALAGQQAQLRRGKKTLAKAEISSRNGQSGATLVVPMPSSADDYKALRVYADGRYISDVVLPDLDAARERTLEGVGLRANPFVFSQIEFPALDFAQPTLVEDLIGVYQISATFYDAAYNPVERAEKPGRYGAVVDIKGADGQHYQRYITLYRHAEPFVWWNAAMSANVALPPQLGIALEVLAYQSAAVDDYFKWSFAADFYENGDSAIFLAALSEANTEEEVDPWATDREWWYGLRRELGAQGLYQHVLHVPATYKDDAEKKWPMLVFLHGSGERGEVLDLVKMHGPPKLAERGEDLPFITVSPQCPLGENWLPRQVVDLVDSLSAVYRVDPDRIYLTGLSMGGFGTWDLAARYPHKFAAIAPICGGGDPATAHRFAHLPTWVFHGALDSSVPIAESQAMVDALTELDADVRFTIYPEAGHDSWTESYDNPALYEWFLSHQRK